MDEFEFLKTLPETYQVPLREGNRFVGDSTSFQTSTNINSSVKGCLELGQKETLIGMVSVKDYLWWSYFGQGSKQDNESLKLVEMVKGRIENKTFNLNMEEVVEKRVVILDYNQLNESTSNKETSQLGFEATDSDLDILSSTFLHKPRIMSKLFCYAVHELHLEKSKDQAEILSIHETESVRPFVFRLINHNPTLPMESLKSSMIEKVVTVIGTAVRTCSVKPMSSQIEFVCLTCEKTQTIQFKEATFTLPTKCLSPGCRSKNIRVERGIDSKTITYDFQTLHIQELKRMDDISTLGKVPRTIECELTFDFVDQIIPGDIVKCTGILKLGRSDDIGGKTSSKSTIHTVYLELFYITKLYTTDFESEDAVSQAKDEIEFKDQDFQFIIEVFNEPQLLQLLVNSFCPEIFGHEAIKLGILLGLFGGRKRHKVSFNGKSIRSDPHILIVGDPGLGKSKMLSSAVSLSPRGTYVCASSGISSMGLTATLVKENSSNHFALEAGALVIGDQGCCCIDEFDNLLPERVGLLEAMEQQSIKVIKGGIICNLPSRTSVIAAANPVGSHYNKAKTVAENLKMTTTLLSRFDLTFVLLDKPDAIIDHHLSKLVMALHSGPNSHKRFESVSSFGFESSQNDLSLIQRLRMDQSQRLDPLPTLLFRKYISYARTYVHPTLSSEASSTIKSFYLELRKEYRSHVSTPITTRQLESLVRLAEARAKMELREVVTEQDAKDVVDLMKLSLLDAHVDVNGGFDFKKPQSSGMSREACIKSFIAHLKKVSEETGCSIFPYSKLCQFLKDLNLNLKTDFSNFIVMLNLHGYLLKRGPNSYQLLATEH